GLAVGEVDLRRLDERLAKRVERKLDPVIDVEEPGDHDEHHAERDAADEGRGLPRCPVPPPASAPAWAASRPAQAPRARAGRAVRTPVILPRQGDEAVVCYLCAAQIAGPAAIAVVVAPRSVPIGSAGRVCAAIAGPGRIAAPKPPLAASRGACGSVSVPVVSSPVVTGSAVSVLAVTIAAVAVAAAAVVPGGIARDIPCPARAPVGTAA